MAPTFLPVISTVQDLAESHDIEIASLKHTSVDSALFVISINNNPNYLSAISINIYFPLIIHALDRRQRPVLLLNLAQVSVLTPKTF
jgi:hypothetical protein